MSKQTPLAPTASAIGPCLTLIQIVGRPGTGSLPRTIAPPDHPRVALRPFPNAIGCFRGGIKVTPLLKCKVLTTF